jgi:hypothetical protein
MRTCLLFVLCLVAAATATKDWLDGYQPPYAYGRQESIELFDRVPKQCTPNGIRAFIVSALEKYVAQHGYHASLQRSLWIRDCPDKISIFQDAYTVHTIKLSHESRGLFKLSVSDTHEEFLDLIYFNPAYGSVIWERTLQAVDALLKKPAEDSWPLHLETRYAFLDAEQLFAACTKNEF